MCHYLLVGHITELGITKGPSAATRTPVYSSLSVIQIPGHYNISEPAVTLCFRSVIWSLSTSLGGGGASERVLTLRWLVACVKREESASFYIVSFKDVIC